MTYAGKTYAGDPYAAQRSTAAPAQNALTLTLPRFGATLAGTRAATATTGTLAATLPRFTAAAVGAYSPGRAGTLQVALPAFSASLAGARTIPATSAALAVALPVFSAQLTATVPVYVGLLPAFGADLEGSVTVVFTTDTSYRNDGYSYTGSADVIYTAPLAALPPGLERRDVRRVHQSLPTPTLVKGRPQ